MNFPILTTEQLIQHLRSLRKRRGLSQAELGAKLGITQSRIGRIERDPGTVSIGQLMQLLAMLDARLELVDAKATPPKPGANTAPRW